MANASSTGFGLRPLKKAGQNRDSGGLGEYPVAASATAIYNQDMVAWLTQVQQQLYYQFITQVLIEKKINM